MRNIFTGKKQDAVERKMAPGTQSSGLAKSENSKQVRFELNEGKHSNDKDDPTWDSDAESWIVEDQEQREKLVRSVVKDVRNTERQIKKNRVPDRDKKSRPPSKLVSELQSAFESSKEPDQQCSIS